MRRRIWRGGGVEQGQKVTEDSDNIVKRLHFVCVAMYTV